MTLEGKPEQMSWFWWSVYKGARAIGHTLQYMNSWGEWFADEIGITRPMYEDLINQHKELVSTIKAILRQNFCLSFEKNRTCSK